MLVRLGKEHRATVHAVRVRQSGAGRQAFYRHRNPKTVLISERRGEQHQFIQKERLSALKNQLFADDLVRPRIHAASAKKWIDQRFPKEQSRKFKFLLNALIYYSSFYYAAQVSIPT